MWQFWGNTAGTGTHWWPWDTGTPEYHELAEHAGSPTSWRAKPWGWEWAWFLLGASPRRPGSPEKEDERGEGSKRGCQERTSAEAPGRRPPSQDSSLSSRAA